MGALLHDPAILRVKAASSAAFSEHTQRHTQAAALLFAAATHDLPMLRQAGLGAWHSNLSSWLRWPQPPCICAMPRSCCSGWDHGYMTSGWAAQRMLASAVAAVGPRKGPARSPAQKVTHLDHRNGRGIPDGGQAVRDDEGGAPCLQLGQGVLRQPCRPHAQLDQPDGSCSGPQQPGQISTPLTMRSAVQCAGTGHAGRCSRGPPAPGARWPRPGRC